LLFAFLFPLTKKHWNQYSYLVICKAFYFSGGLTRRHSSGTDVIGAFKFLILGLVGARRNGRNGFPFCKRRWNGTVVYKDVLLFVLNGANGDGASGTGSNLDKIVGSRFLGDEEQKLGVP
jgi:hypothetical protein